MTLLKTLLNAGILTYDAHTLAEHFVDQPVIEFLEGLEMVARCLALNESPGMIQSGAEPWDTIHQVMLKNGDYETAFQNALSAYDSSVQLAVSGAVAVRRRELMNWQTQHQQTSKKRKTIDYIRLLKYLGFTFQYNECTKEIEVNGKSITDEIAAEIRTKLRDAGIQEVHVAEDAYIVEGWKNQYHPVKKYLTGLTYQGGDPISELVGYFLDDHEVFGVWLRRWLVGACARVMQGAQNRVLVLDGRQGLGKDSFAKWLGNPLEDYYYEGTIIPEDKDCRLRRLWTWIWNVNEFGNTTRRADREALKAFITTQIIRERRAYGRYDTRGSAMTSFIGTVNNEIGILNDPTGSRRFMIVHLKEIDWNYIKIDVDQIWAQAFDLYLSGEKWELEGQEKTLAADINESYQMLDVVEETIRKYFKIDVGNKTMWCSTLDILTELKTKGDLKAGVEVDARRIASALTKMGLEKPVQRKISGAVVRGYFGIEFDQRLP